MRRGPLAFALLSVGCGGGMGEANLVPYEQVGVFVRNRSQEILCEAHIAPTDSRDDTDRLEPTEVIPPGGSRYFALEPGEHSIRLLDCNGDVVLRRANVRIGDRGVMLSFEER